MIGFGEIKKFERKRKLEITKLTDNRLLVIDPTIDGFYDNVLHFKSDNTLINLFIDAIHEVQEAKLSKFWRPVMDPSLEYGQITYNKGLCPAADYTVNWWIEESKKIPSVEGKTWALGNEYEYYADEVALINDMIEKGIDLHEAIHKVVIDSTSLGNYFIYGNLKNCLESTGSREICGRYDLANTRKLLSCSKNEFTGYWIAGGNFYDFGHNSSLANLNYHDSDFEAGLLDCVGWLVLK